MTEKKQPEPGEWWQKKKTIRGVKNPRVFVLGKSPDGKTVGMRHWLPGEIRRDDSAFFYGTLDGIEGMEHLPECTGWDWQPEPVESPDDWVTQDRVYDRPGIDQWRRVFDGIPDDWRWSSEDEARYMHGHTALSGRSVFEVRCRRKDLPVMPEQTQKREYVRILINQARGSVSIVHGDCDIVLEGCDEVRHDGTGFYLVGDEK